jgi:hypothetical protein
MGKNHLGSTTGLGTIFDQVKRSKIVKRGVDKRTTVVRLRESKGNPKERRNSSALPERKNLKWFSSMPTK